MEYDPETGTYRVKWCGTPADIARIRKEIGMKENKTTVRTHMGIPILWKLYGVTKDDEKTWLGDFVNEAEISGIANFFANNPHFEHMEIHEGLNFKYAVMRIVGGRQT